MPEPILRRSSLRRKENQTPNTGNDKAKAKKRLGQTALGGTGATLLVIGRANLKRPSPNPRHTHVAPSTKATPLHANINVINAANMSTHIEHGEELPVVNAEVDLEKQQSYEEHAPETSTSRATEGKIVFFSDELKQRVAEWEARRVEQRNEKWELLKARLAEWRKVEGL